MYGLTKIEAGLYRHVSGWMLVKTEAHEGPLGGELARWEDAQWGDYGGLEIMCNVFETRLRDAVPALERAIEQGHTPPQPTSKATKDASS